MTFAAIDAGSNAIRLVIARLYADGRMRRIVKERFAVRLGHNAFTGRRRLDADTIHRAVIAFRAIREAMEDHGVEKFRAVATSAAREAANRAALLRAIHEETGIELEVIDGPEEARLVRAAVLDRLVPTFRPRLITDLGGGSLELNLMRGSRVELSRTLPIGTVRLMERNKIRGAIGRRDTATIEKHALSLLRRACPKETDLSGSVAVACGGNAEALARLAEGARNHGIRTMNSERLDAVTRDIARMTVRERMHTYEVREDRAEVMGIAALVFSAMSRWLGVESWLVPGVGVREGILADLSRPQRAVRKQTPKARTLRRN